MLSRRHALTGAAGAMLVAAIPARAQPAYPDRPVKILVGYAPGGGVDIVARLLAEKMRQSLGQPVLVENRGGRDRRQPGAVQATHGLRAAA
jgi:tripartite-type tricarboxylate transporter receptor subunit TctC